MLHKFILVIFIIIGIKLQAQHADSLTAVNFFGTTYAVKQGEALSLHQLKKIIRDNPQAFQEFKKARRQEYANIALTLIGIVALTASFIAEDNVTYWGGIALAGGVFGTSIIIKNGPYSKHILRTIQLHNKQFQ